MIYYDLIFYCGIVRDFIIFIQFTKINQHFFIQLKKLPDGFFQKLFMWKINFVLYNIINLNNEIVLVTHFFLNKLFDYLYAHFFVPSAMKHFKG